MSRLRGDEFALLLQSPVGEDDVEAFTKRLVAAFAQPFPVAGRGLRLGASIGRAMFPDDGDGAEALLRAADEAMFEAKRGFDRDAPGVFRRARRA